MRDYDELVKRLRAPVMWDDGEDCDACEMLQDDAADAIEELLGKACPHYHKNVHDRGDDSYCDLPNREVPKEGKR